MAVGILIATLSGLCSAWFLVMTLSSYGEGEFLTAVRDSGLSVLILVATAVIGGLPIMSGIGLFHWGRAPVRRARERDEASWLKEP